MEEHSGFHLPPGFEIRLVASEPQIAKPLNMAFDADHRLWVSDTTEYPYPAAAGQTPRDSIKVLHDTDGDHRIDRVTTFVDGLNIPIGLLPYGDGVIAFSIPNLWYFRDLDHDGRCDERQIILGPFDTSRDTHGMINSLRQGFDGWIYACHGFSNQSRVRGADGWEIEMTSGNTFRFRPGGERVENYSFGQVNPFGMTCDAWGNWFSADCHSHPITQLIRGGHYPSFGRPHDGLGHLPPMMNHLHGSTAIAGLVWYDDTQFPPPYQSQFYSGNVMTSRINRNSVRRRGATFTAHEQPDFLTSDDTWFRPVDLQLAPDGSLYVADFYNRIIGHYEVPLDHPGRDRQRGRIWRIAARPAPAATDPTRVTPHGNTPARITALNRQIAAVTESPDASTGSVRVEHPDALWIAARQDRLATDTLIGAMTDGDPQLRTHAMLVAGERDRWDDTLRHAVVGALTDPEPLVVRAAAEALGRHPHGSQLSNLLKRLQEVPEDDFILRQSIRIAVRDSMLDPGVVRGIDASSLLNGPYGASILEIMLGVQSPDAATWIADWIGETKEPSPLSLQDQLPAIEHALAYLPEAAVEDYLRLLQQRTQDDPQLTHRLLSRLHQSRPGTALDTVQTARQWAQSWADHAYHAIDRHLAANDQAPVRWLRSDGAGHWPREPRDAEDHASHSYHSSFALGESYTGSVRSDPFAAPTELKFWIVGHDGPPNQPAAQRNHVRLIHVASGEILHRAQPPRHDRGREVVWDLSEVAGEACYVEAVDGDGGDAFAWLAVGRFSTPSLQDDSVDALLQPWLDLIGQYRLTEQAASIDRLLTQHVTLNVSHQVELLSVACELRQDPIGASIAETLRHLSISQESLNRVRAMILRGQSSLVDRQWLRDAARQSTRAVQDRMAASLAKRRESLPWLVDAVAEGWIHGDALRLQPVTAAIASLADDTLRRRVDELFKGLPEPDDSLAQWSAEALDRFRKQPGVPAQGAAVFQQHCASCHQLGAIGSIVGPQLEGVGGRGADRLLEDILQPDRNVDRAFRTTSFVLDDGTVCVGLIRHENEQVIEVVENNAKVRRLSPNEVEERVTTTRSLMPSGFHQAIGDQGINDLLAFLLQPTTQSPTADQTPLAKPVVERP